MARPVKCRRVEFIPDVIYFKPAGVPLRLLEEVILTMEETESLRLKDIEGLDQAESAAKMNISRPTFQRILGTARKKVADAIVNGKAIRIEGGRLEPVPIILKCGNGHEWDLKLVAPVNDLPVCPTCGSPSLESALPRCMRNDKTHRCHRRAAPGWLEKIQLLTSTEDALNQRRNK